MNGMLAFTLSTCTNISYLQTAFLARPKFMKACSTFHGFILDLHKKVLENVSRECSSFCCGENPPFWWVRTHCGSNKAASFCKLFISLVSVTRIACSSTR